MKYNILTENTYIYQGLSLFEQRQVQKWERIGIELKEAQLTADQIQQLFQQIEQETTAGGSNRTVLGKGKDMATAVNSAWKDLKSTIYNSGPMEGFAAKYDTAVQKLKQATGGDDGAMKYVQKYRKFAEKHPILQGAMYAALITAAGLSGAGLGGAAAIGLFKLTDQLLQGKDVRSALYQGAKTGAIAYGTAKLIDFVQGGGAEAAGTGDAAAGSSAPDIDAASQAKIDNLTSKYPPDQYTYQDAGTGNINIVDANGELVANADIKSTGLNGQQFVDKVEAGSAANVATGGSPDLADKIFDQNLNDGAGRTQARMAIGDALKNGDITDDQARQLLDAVKSSAQDPAAAEKAIADTLNVQPPAQPDYTQAQKDFFGGDPAEASTALSDQQKNTIAQDIAKKMGIEGPVDAKFQADVPVEINGQPVPAEVQNAYKAGATGQSLPGSQIGVGDTLPDGSKVTAIDSSNPNFGVTVEKPDGSTVPMGRQEIQDLSGQQGAANTPRGGVSGGGASDPTAGTGIATDVKTTTTPDGTTTTSGNLQGVTQGQIQNHPAYRAEIERWGDSAETRKAAAMKARSAILKGESTLLTGRKLSEGQCYYLFKMIADINNRMISEGKIWELGRRPLQEQEKTAWQKIKSKAADVGKNLTTKVTASKLTAAWKKAQSPSDSDQVAELLKSQGVNDQVIAKAFAEMKLPAPGKGATAREVQTLKAELAKLGPQTRQQLITQLQQQLGTA